ncbi:MAG: phospholipase D-like domain-containing protein [Candidatus Daviesbacteria bacterium]|nr:phospholipase D-like domain-containing protein [Candidatus Daviesbacteria bacterium]
MNSLQISQLHDENTFYQSFVKDLNHCQKEVIIESPYITAGRMNLFRPIFQKLLKRGVKIYVFTRDPKEHEEGMELQSESEISNFERMGVEVLLCIGNHHRKLAILDRKVLWEGSLNILSQAYSREIMRRIENKEIAMQMFEFLKLEKFL